MMRGHLICKNIVLQSRLSSNGHHVRLLQQEMQVLSALPVAESLTWVRDSVAAVMASEIDWLTKVEQALMSAGYDTLMSGKSKFALGDYSRCTRQTRTHRNNEFLPR